MRLECINKCNSRHLAGAIPVAKNTYISPSNAGDSLALGFQVVCVEIGCDGVCLAVWLGIGLFDFRSLHGSLMYVKDWPEVRASRLADGRDSRLFGLVVVECTNSWRLGLIRDDDLVGTYPIFLYFGTTLAACWSCHIHDCTTSSQL